VSKTVAICKSGLATINRSLAQTRTVSCFTRVLVWLGGLHIGGVGTLLWQSSYCILVVLIKTLSLMELVIDSLVSRKQKEAETNAKIVDLFKDALHEIKHCRNEQQRVEFHIALACVMPERETQGTNNGWITRIYDRFALKRGKRSQKNGGRPYASDQAVDIRAGSDDTSTPVTMRVNSSELRVVDFPLSEVRPLQLDVVAHGVRRTHGAAVRKLQGVGNSTFVLSVENDKDFRSRCE
jgi:hypothetical protein